MKKNIKSFKYKKVKKYTAGVQSTNADPTLQYSTNRNKNTIGENNFNDSQQALMGKGIAQQQYQDKTNQAQQNLSNVKQDASGTSAGISSTVATVGDTLGAVPIVGGIAKAGSALGDVGRGMNNKAGDVITGAFDPGTSVQTGLKTGNGNDLLKGLLGVGGVFINKGTEKDIAEKKAAYNTQQQQQANKQLNKYGAIDTTYQTAQAKNGNSGIHIKPENKGKFTAYKKRTGKTTEEALHSSNAHVRQMANFARNASHWNHKQKGVREIETEGREPIFSPKKKDGTRDLLYYNPSDPKHSEGGVTAKVISKSKYKMKGGNKDLVIPEGSAIITANQGKNKEALKAYKKGDYKKLEKVINKMPNDNNTKKASGSGFTVATEDDAQNSLNASIDSKLKKNDPTIITPVSQNTTSNTSSSFGDKVGNFASSIGGLSPALYNLGQGIFGKTSKTNRRYVNNEGYKYKDMSAPARRAANEAQLVESNNIRNATGGAGGTYLANQALASSNRFKNISDINTQQSGLRQDIENQNVDTRNQQNQTNLGLANQYDILDLQNKGKKSEFLGKGLEGLSQASQMAQLNNNRSKSDNVRLNLMKSENYSVDKNGNITPKSKKGLKNIKYKMKQ